MKKTTRARDRSAVTMITLRFQRSTKTPAIRPTSRLGAAVAISINPTERAEPVMRKMRMPADSDVRALPAVETSWALHSSVKLRLRKIAYGETLGAAAVTAGSV